MMNMLIDNSVMNLEEGSTKNNYFSFIYDYYVKCKFDPVAIKS